MTVLRRPTSPTHETPTASFTTFATPTRGNAPVAVWEVELRAGAPAATHELTRGEVFVALAGRATAVLAGEQLPLTAGDILVVPPHTPFALEADVVEPFRALCVLPADGRAVLPGGEPFTPPWAL